MIGSDQFQLERYEDVRVMLTRSVVRSPGHHWSYPILAAAYGHLGLEHDAIDTLEPFNEIRGHSGPVSYYID